MFCTGTGDLIEQRRWDGELVFDAALMTDLDPAFGEVLREPASKAFAPCSQNRV
jgi:hypothetical protein